MLPQQGEGGRPRALLCGERAEKIKRKKGDCTAYLQSVVLLVITASRKRLFYSGKSDEAGAPLRRYGKLFI